MRIVFMGTPDFAVPSLEKLIDSPYEIVGVFTQPDKPVGRGKKIKFNPVKEFALNNNIQVYQPTSLRNDESFELVNSLEPDMIVVAAYGKILPKNILDIPKYGCINVHGSLLPKYRGAAPIQWSVLNGDETTGVTIMYMGVGLDTGDMITKAEVKIDENETSAQLFERLKVLGAELLIETIPNIFSGNVIPAPQNEDESTHAPMISKDMSDIHWEKSAKEIHNLIRGLNSWPCATTMLNGKKTKIFTSEVIDDKGQCGNVFLNDGYLCVHCGDESIKILELQQENGKRMTSKSYLLGHPITDETKTIGNIV